MGPARARERLVLLLAVSALAFPAAARADGYVAPFFGTTFGTKTTTVRFEPPTKTWIFGASGVLLGDGIFGLEADLAFAPGILEGENTENLSQGSRVMTLFGNVLAAVPLSITRESLRPYLLGGLGLVQTRLDDRLGLGERDSALGLQVGGGAIGMVSNRTGLRFDVRHTRSFERAIDPFTLERGTKLKFWRATGGVLVRF